VPSNLKNTYCCPSSKYWKWIGNWRDGKSTPKILQYSAAFFQLFDHGAALKIERKMSHLNIAFDRYASLGTVMHCILVISGLELGLVKIHSRVFEKLQQIRRTAVKDITVFTEKPAYILPI